MSENVILREDDYNEWWQPELHCEKCDCTFMWQSYPDFSDYPNFCPNCGKKFTALRKDKALIFTLDDGQLKGIADVNY